MVVDTHVWRVARRFGLVGGRADPDGVRRLVMQEAPTSWGADDFYELHWLMKRLGQTFCADARPRCGACPLSRQCASRLMGPLEGAAARAA
jgi:endonuclease-3